MTKSRYSCLVDTFSALALDRNLTGNDIRVALLLAESYRRPGDLVRTLGKDKTTVSHSLRHLVDCGWASKRKDDEGQVWYSLANKNQQANQMNSQIPGQMSIGDYNGVVL